METKHTKGEWVAENKRVKTKDGNSIASTWITRGLDILDERLDGESWLDMRHRTKEERFIYTDIEPAANAKLMAAAPDLLEACIEALESLKVLVAAGDIMKNTIAQNRLNSAIKKATE